MASKGSPSKFGSKSGSKSSSKSGASTSRIVRVVNDEMELARELAEIIKKYADVALKRRSVCNVGLSGGSMIKLLCKSLPLVSSDWSKWKFFFCDERLVPFDNPDSTFGSYKKDLLPEVPIPEEQFVVIDPELNAEDAAKDYENKLRQCFSGEKLPVFDILLLGMGPDGHTCSLFPGHPLLKETEMMIAPVTDSPKPPKNRVTMTFPVINNAKCAIFAIGGADKADIVKKVLESEEEEEGKKEEEKKEDDDSDRLPAALVKLHDGMVHWILHKSAAAELKVSMFT